METLVQDPPAVIMDRWIEALKSGEYSQGDGYLCRYNDNGERAVYCCLGVVTELVNPEHVKLKASYGPSRSNGWELPEDIQTLLNLKNAVTLMGKVAGYSARNTNYILDQFPIPQVFIVDIMEETQGIGTLHEFAGVGKSGEIRKLTPWITLATLNDRGMPFRQIAKILERIKVFFAEDLVYEDIY